MQETQNPTLSRTLSPVMVWGLGVGYVISGMYFGWNIGLARGGTLGLAIATFFITIMYVCFTVSYTELACAMPRAGGAFTYAHRAFGPKISFIAGLVQIIEFVFAPPAIAFAIGSYLHIFLPQLPVIAIACCAYILFTTLNIIGVRAAATFELWITVLAIGELLLFSFITLPHVQWKHLSFNPLPFGWSGVFAAIPFAIWFFLAIEGVANLAEETINPQRTLVKGFGMAMLTLVVLCLLTFISAVGVGGWEAIVFVPGSTVVSDSPLPLALAKVTGNSHLLYHMLITIGIFGLLASFHGIILASGRATLEFARSGYAPQVLSQIHPKFKTPAMALLANTTIGLICLATGKTSELITLACFGALSLYILSIICLFRLRVKEPELERPFRVFFYPYLPLIALSLAVISLFSLSYYYPLLALIFSVMVGGSTLIFSLTSALSSRVSKVE